MTVAVLGSICLLAENCAGTANRSSGNHFGVSVPIDRFFSCRRRSGRGLCGEEPACSFHEKAASFGATDTAVVPCSLKHSLQDQVVRCTRLIRSPELKLISPRAGTKHELAAGENPTPTQHPRLLRGCKGMNAVVRYGDDRALFLMNALSWIITRLFVIHKTSTATFHVEDSVDRLLRQQPLLYLH